MEKGDSIQSQTYQEEVYHIADIAKVIDSKSEWLAREGWSLRATWVMQTPETNSYRVFMTFQKKASIEPILKA